MRASIESQGITAEFETLPDGAYRLALVNANGHVMATSVFAWDEPASLRETPGQQWAPRVANAG